MGFILIGFAVGGKSILNSYPFTQPISALVTANVLSNSRMSYNKPGTALGGAHGNYRPDNKSYRRSISILVMFGV